MDTSPLLVADAPVDITKEPELVEEDPVAIVKDPLEPAAPASADATSTAPLGP